MVLTQDFTSGNVKSQIIKYAIPLMISSMFQTIYTTVDMLIVGRYLGSLGLSSIAVCYPIINLLNNSITGMTIGVAVIIGKYLGVGENKKIEEAANTAIALYLLLGLFISVFGFIFSRGILHIIQTPLEVFELSNSYLKISFLGVIFMFLYNLMCGFQRGLGDSKSTLIFIILTSILNVILDYFFIAIIKTGVKGAALATVISQFVTFILGVIYFRKNKHIITFKLSLIKIHKIYLKEIIVVGVPIAMQQMLLNVSEVIVNSIINTFGVAASAGYGIALKIDAIVFMAMDSINQSISTFVSQNIGSKKLERAIKGTIEAGKISIVVAVIGMITLHLFKYNISSVFDKDTDVIMYASIYMGTMCFAFPGFSIYNCFVGFTRGSGNSFIAFIIGVISTYLVRIPIALMFSKTIGYKIMPFTIIGMLVMSLILYAIFILSGKWKKIKFNS